MNNHNSHEICITKINSIKIDNAEDFDVVMPMYNLLEYSKNYKKTTGSLWNYYRDEPNSSIDNINITHSILNSKSFDYKANFIGSVTNNNLTKNDVKIVIPLKHLSNFWKNLNIPLINCEVESVLSWFKNCVLIDKPTRIADYGADPLSKENDIKLLEKLKSGFKKTIEWN